LVKYKERTGYFMNFLADPKKHVVKKYKQYNPETQIAIKGIYLIDKNGTIAWRYISKEKTDNPSVDLVLQAIDENILAPKQAPAGS
jgi:alkyl hydroperoxide reductase subunit AhpC